MRKRSTRAGITGWGRSTEDDAPITRQGDRKGPTFSDLPFGPTRIMARQHVAEPLCVLCCSNWRLDHEHVS